MQYNIVDNKEIRSRLSVRTHNVLRRIHMSCGLAEFQALNLRYTGLAANAGKASAEPRRGCNADGSVIV